MRKMVAVPILQKYQATSPTARPLSRNQLTPVKYRIVMMTPFATVMWNSTQQNTIWQRPTVLMWPDYAGVGIVPTPRKVWTKPWTIGIGEEILCPGI